MNVSLQTNYQHNVLKKDFLIKSISISFILKQVEENTINEIINNLPSKTNSGYDKIPLKLLKKL